MPAALKDHCGDLPILQVGSCYFEGSMIATLALEQLQPEPSLFPNGNCGMPLALGWWSDHFYNAVSQGNDPAQLHRNATLICRQIANGRDYLQGAEPGLADVHSFSPLKALHEDGYDISPVMKADPLLQSWYQRMDQYKAPDQAMPLTQTPPTDFPECDAIANRIMLDDGKITLWHTSAN